MDEIEDDKVTIIGPDLKEMEEGKTYPWAMVFNIGGELIEADLESVIERRIHDFINYCQGIMHLNQRYDVWMRVSKDTAAKMDSFDSFGKAVMKESFTNFLKIRRAGIMGDTEIAYPIMDFYAIEAGGFGILCCLTELPDDVRHLVGIQGPGNRNWLFSTGCMGKAFDG